MASINEVKSRIQSIEDTMQITKAMKLVSAAKLKQAKNQHERTMPYFTKIELTIADILAHKAKTNNPFFNRRRNKENRRNCYLIMTGDKGLCGGYNHQIFKFAMRYLKRDNNPLLLVCGHMGNRFFKKEGFDVLEDFFFPVQNPNVYRAREIQEKVMQLFIDEEVDNVYLIYTKLENSFTQKPHAMRLLPLTFEAMRKELRIEEIKLRKTSEEMIYEPSADAVFKLLIPKYVKGVILGALVEAFTSEQSARMTAMENATRNAEEMISDLSLIYNRARQTAITQEISEIISGVDVLDG